MAAEFPQLWTIGHSNRSGEMLVAMLRAHGVELVADVRVYPRSRYNPQFNAEALAERLLTAGIGYVHLRELGGNRQPRSDSRNLALPAGTFRGYADYMESAAFAQGIDRLAAIAGRRRTAILCAEADPLHCHRSLIADTLTAVGWQVVHILSETAATLHQLRPECRLENGKPGYRGSQLQLSLGE